MIRMPMIWRVALALGLGAAIVQPSFAARSAGETVVYEITVIQNNKADLSSLPAMVRSRAEANQAAANGKKITTTLTLNVDAVDDEGNGHVLASYHQSMDGLTGSVATAFAAAQSFQGTLTPDGRLLPTYDQGMAAPLDSHGRYSAAVTENIHASQMLGTFGNFNTFVSGLVKHPQLKDGDVWHLVSRDTFGISRQYDFSVRGSEVSMEGSFTAPNSTSKIVAAGRYDPVRRLLVEFREENSYASTNPNGISSSGTMTSAIKLIR